MINNASPNTNHIFFEGGGITGEIIKNFNWSETSLGDIETWPQSLKTTVSIVLNNDLPMYIAWGDDFIQFYNDAYIPIIGSLKHPKAIGQKVQECFVEFSHIYLDMFEQVRTGKCVSFNDYEVVLHRNGFEEKCFFNFSFSPVRVEDGSIGGILVTVIENTNKILQRQALIESEKNFINIFSNAPVAISVLRGENYVIELANNLMLELWGKTKEIINKPFFENRPDIAGQGLEEIFKEVYTTGKVFESNEYPLIIEKSGNLERIYVNFIHEPYKNPEGEIVGIITVGTDVTNQVLYRERIEESVKEFRQIADSMPQMVWTSRPDGVVDYFNKQWYDYTGLPEEYGNQNWLKILHPDDVDFSFETWANAVKTGNDYDIEYRFLDPKTPGTYRWFLGRAVPIKDENGNILKWFGTCTDITEQKIQQQIKEEFISVASHELKTPLTSLRASVQLLKKKIINEASASEMVSNLITKADIHVHKLTSLVEDLLNTTRLEQGYFSLNKSNFKLSTLINDCCEVIRSERKNLIITQHNTDITVYADQQRLEQVLTNLMNNAVKYAPNSDKIIVSCAQEKGFTKVSIQDFGIGVPKEKTEKLFHRFYRVEDTGMQYSGLGLGLYISSEVIHKHGGEMGVESELGKGSTFWFTIPNLETKTL